MKKENAKPYKELGKDWTIKRIDDAAPGDIYWRETFQALNIRTGKTYPQRRTYDEALKDIAPWE